METKRSTFATSFYIKRSAVRNRDGKAPIMVKISVDGDDKAVGTKLFVTPDLWENGKAKGKSAEANEINGQLKEVSARLTKTRVSSNVPLMEIAKELIERYKGLAGGDLVFPIPSNSVCNRHLKQIAKACGIHKEIGFHLSRHTFATTVYLCNGGTIEALSKILGHKHISTTQIYAEVTNRMVSSDFRAISGNLAAMQRSVLEKKDRKQDGKRVRRSLRETA